MSRIGILIFMLVLPATMSRIDRREFFGIIGGMTLLAGACWLEQYIIKSNTITLDIVRKVKANSLETLVNSINTRQDHNVDELAPPHAKVNGKEIYLTVLDTQGYFAVPFGFPDETETSHGKARLLASSKDYNLCLGRLSQGDRNIYLSPNSGAEVEELLYAVNSHSTGVWVTGRIPLRNSLQVVSAGVPESTPIFDGQGHLHGIVSGPGKAVNYKMVEGRIVHETYGCQMAASSLRLRKMISRYKKACA